VDVEVVGDLDKAVAVLVDGARDFDVATGR
jgi:hypothetical protein